MKKIILFLLLAITLNAYAVFEDLEPSARARGMGGAYASLSNDASGVFYNPAGLSLAESNEVEVGYTDVFGLKFHNVKTIASAFKLPGNYGSIGISMLAHDVEYDDVDLLSEKTYTLAHSFALNKDLHSELYFGYSLNIYQLSMDRMDDDTAFGLNVGATGKLFNRFLVGFYAKNLNSPEISEHEDLPQKLDAGISYMPYEGVTTTFELEKNLDYFSDTEMHAGVELVVNQYLTLRTGIRNNPNQYSAGFSAGIHGVTVNYAVQTHVLGNTHHVSLGYKF